MKAESYFLPLLFLRIQAQHKTVFRVHTGNLFKVRLEVRGIPSRNIHEYKWRADNPITSQPTIATGWCPEIASKAIAG